VQQCLPDVRLPSIYVRFEEKKTANKEKKRKKENITGTQSMLS